MPGAARKVAIVIGVSEAKPLRYIGGAVNSARAFHDWAIALGYESRLIVDEDEDNPVTVERLRTELQSVLTAPIQRLVIYFAGHGLIRGAEEGLWLLSDWRAALRAVAYEVLKRRLYMHNVRQIAIFADACRSLPTDFPSADLTADGVLGSGPVRSDTTPDIDKFVAAQDGFETFVIPGATPEEDRCLFSGVLLEGLWGIKPGAFSKSRTDKITSQSLATYLKAEVPVVAKRYEATLNPITTHSFAEGEDIYFGEGQPPKPPALPDWPPPEAVRALRAQGAGERRRKSFDKAKIQAQVVGSSVFSFAPGVDVAMRTAISDSALLAQLAADKRASATEDPLGWYAHYFEVLENLGWATRESGWTDYTTQGTASEVHEKIIEVMRTALGPSPAALAIITQTIQVLKDMAADSESLKIFNSESRHARLGRMQVGLVERDRKGNVVMSLLSCLVEARNTITQILFLKFGDARATFKANSRKISIKHRMLIELGPVIREKVLAYQADYLGAVKDL